MWPNVLVGAVSAMLGYVVGATVIARRVERRLAGSLEDVLWEVCDVISREVEAGGKLQEWRAVNSQPYTRPSSPSSDKIAGRMETLERPAP